MELNEKIIYGLERLSDVFKSLLWEKAKQFGISPIQIQILLFVRNHKSELCNISHLAREFNVTKPTISDAVRVLHKKNYLEKDFSPSDNRSYYLFTTETGKKLLKEIADYALPVKKGLETIDEKGLENLYSVMTKLIFNLNQKGVLTVQRTCFGCRFYQNQDKKHYCNLLEKQLEDTQIRLDCPEFEEKLD